MTLVPVLVVETKYQVRTAVLAVFGTTDIRTIFIPNFALDLRGFSADHQDNGIVIPKIYLDEPIVFNVDPNDAQAYTAALKKGIAHASGTRLPDTGGLGYYFAHSSQPSFVSQYNAVFSLLGKLQEGDEVFVFHEGKRFEYRVTKTEEVSPNDTRFLNTAYENEIIVLQTCWPPGTTLRRKLVFAERVTR